MTTNPPQYRYGKTLQQSSARAERARQLRSSSTMPEKILWNAIRNRKIERVKFRRQFPIGPYTLDFFAEELKLCLEVDGVQHAASAEEDRSRDAWLKARGITVVRYRAKDVSEITQSVVDALKIEITKIRGGEDPHPNPLPMGEGAGRNTQ